MAIKRYIATLDNTITNAYKEDFNTRGTGSNMGQSDILEVFGLYSQQSSGSSEVARTIIQFPVSNISTDRVAGTIPASGSVSFYLNLYNAKHDRTLPRDFYLTIAALKNAWQEGNGLDMENYTDLTYDNIGSNWINRQGSTAWTTAGGDFYTDSSSSFTQRFERGDENLELDITTLVEQWINSGGNVLGSKTNYGVIIKMTPSYEPFTATNTGGAKASYYTKKFFARGTEFFYNRPSIEARWDSSKRDNRGNFYFSSSLAPAEDNLNCLYLYNYIRGRLRDIEGNSAKVPVLNLYQSSGSIPEGTALYFRDSNNEAVNFLSASRESTGLYKVSFSATASVTNTTYTNLVDVWTYSGSQVHTGSSFTPLKYDLSDTNPYGNYVISMPNLKKSYKKGQTERFRLYVRNKNWNPNVYTRVISTPETLMIQSASYQITRMIDNRSVIPYGTGSDNYTMLSYDVSGNYFDLDMNLFEAGYSYGIRYSFYEDSLSSYKEQPYIFKFHVSEDPNLNNGE